MKLHQGIQCNLLLGLIHCGTLDLASEFFISLISYKLLWNGIIPKQLPIAISTELWVATSVTTSVRGICGTQPPSV